MHWKYWGCYTHNTSYSTASRRFASEFTRAILAATRCLQKQPKPSVNHKDRFSTQELYVILPWWWNNKPVERYDSFIDKLWNGSFDNPAFGFVLVTTNKNFNSWTVPNVIWTLDIGTSFVNHCSFMEGCSYKLVTPDTSWGGREIRFSQWLETAMSAHLGYWSAGGEFSWQISHFITQKY